MTVLYVTEFHTYAVVDRDQMPDPPDEAKGHPLPVEVRVVVPCTGEFAWPAKKGFKRSEHGLARAYADKLEHETK